MAEIATHELVYTAIQGSVDRLKILELHHRLPRRTDADDDDDMLMIHNYTLQLNSLIMLQNESKETKREKQESDNSVLSNLECSIVAIRNWMELRR